MDCIRPTEKSRRNARAYQKRKALKIEPSEARKTQNARQVEREARKSKYLQKANTGGFNVAFPPTPPSLAELHGIVSNATSAVQPDKFIEEGCAVCGMLTPVAELTSLKDF
ncbi:hypothetical protein DFH07DRAFT_741549 [Mycena maculata]|uniref:Uncharacterized protein n=1 Tax=Mycena maculata TaxID=230809 RepID=A0AAD7J700_9AGAR|nr:hypothetical protein DFH07DRAFT_741549 [Mycena maculata]